MTYYHLKSCLYLALVILGFTGCKKTSEATHLEASKAFYQAMSASNFDQITQLYYDSVRVLEGSYASAYALENYRPWLEWDAVFEPTYNVIALEEGDNSVIATVEKTCRRTLFLNVAPTITQEKLTFKDGKIWSLEIMAYTQYDDVKWNGNRELLVAWIAQNYPELNGFEHDQTKVGGQNYLRAIELYENRVGN
ncbi:MAG: hypothetical protein RIF33_21495 [Cyclobacteriaceae bacterium]